MGFYPTRLYIMLAQQTPAHVRMTERACLYRDGVNNVIVIFKMQGRYRSHGSDRWTSFSKNDKI